jgi:hypothetical protein
MLNLSKAEAILRFSINLRERLDWYSRHGGNMFFAREPQAINFPMEGNLEF